ncbi:MAG: glycosyltransferase family 2 protein, partial [Lachnospiraceae bacterium]|nr:glycosyltransferase family 2 protein [Lachnospiraceae bacterium]
AGEKVFYASRAQVCHFHNYTAKQQYSRNFDLGVSHADHPEVFQGLNVKGEGGRLVKGCTKYLIKQGKFYLIPKFICHCGARYLGYRKGLHYKKLSKKKIRRITGNREYWEQFWRRTEIPGDLSRGYGKNAEGL